MPWFLDVCHYFWFPGCHEIPWNPILLPNLRKKRLQTGPSKISETLSKSCQCTWAPPLLFMPSHALTIWPSSPWNIKCFQWNGFKVFSIQAAAPKTPNIWSNLDNRFHQVQMYWPYFWYVLIWCAPRRKSLASMALSVGLLFSHPMQSPFLQIWWKSIEKGWRLNGWSLEEFALNDYLPVSQALRHWPSSSWKARAAVERLNCIRMRKWQNTSPGFYSMVFDMLPKKLMSFSSPLMFHPFPAPKGSGAGTAPPDHKKVSVASSQINTIRSFEAMMFFLSMTTPLDDKWFLFLALTPLAAAPGSITFRFRWSSLAPRCLGGALPPLWDEPGGPGSHVGTWNPFFRPKEPLHSRFPGQGWTEGPLIWLHYLRHTNGKAFFALAVAGNRRAVNPDDPLFPSMWDIPTEGTRLRVDSSPRALLGHLRRHPAGAAGTASAGAVTGEESGTRAAGTGTGGTGTLGIGGDTGERGFGGGTGGGAMRGGGDVGTGTGADLAPSVGGATCPICWGNPSRAAASWLSNACSSVSMSIEMCLGCDKASPWRKKSTPQND